MGQTNLIRAMQMRKNLFKACTIGCILLKIEVRLSAHN